MPVDRYRILALDVDGTLLDPSGRLPERTAAAVRRAAAAGLRPVLCTGRRYRRALPVAESLGIDAPLVCNSGALVKDPEGHRTLWRADLGPGLAGEVLRMLRERGQPAVSMIDHGPTGPDFLVERFPTGRRLFDDYVGRNREHAGERPGWMAEAGPAGHFHLFAIGDRPGMLGLEAEIVGELGVAIRTFVQRSPAYEGTMCEVLRADASKWAGVVHLAEIWGVWPEEVVAVGDDMNDVPMLAGAGLGVAMGHAPEAVRAAADRVLAGDNGGAELAEFIEGLVG
jgi:hydroxymethylpyrimidine pyrophosphatase-like HAD family hydrolase